MIRRFIFLTAALALAGAAACQKETPAPAPVGREDGRIEVSVTIKGTPTSKATGVSYDNESKVSTLQVFVFAGNDLEAHRWVDNSDTALVPATTGERTVYAVVNAPDLYKALNVSDADPMTLSKLNGALSRLSDNALDGFVMSGSVKENLVDGGSVTVKVRRLVSRVSISKISASLKDYREHYSVRIRSIYLVNVPGNGSYDLSVGATSWVNKLGHNDYQYDGFLFDNLVPKDIVIRNDRFQKNGVDIGEDEAWVYDKMIVGLYELEEGVTRVEDNSYEEEHVFYCYPNSYGVGEGMQTDYSDFWTARGTILVIEAQMYDAEGRVVEIQGTSGQTIGYYPITLPALERNKTYNISEIKITRLPGEFPYKPIETGESKVNISVAEWELGLNMGTVSI